MSDDVSDFLGIKAKDEEKKNEIVQAEIIEPTKSESDQQNLDDDFNFSRDNLYEAIQKGKQALDELFLVASQSESPRAYEVFSALLSNLVIANKDLVDLSKKKMEAKTKISEATGEENKKNVTNNNLFVGSTRDFQELLEQMKDNGESS